MTVARAPHPFAAQRLLNRLSRAPHPWCGWR